MEKTAQVEDIRKEPLIKKRWGFKKTNPSSYSEGILITGPNSFLGSYSVKLLQGEWPGKIHLLIRATNQKEAIKKMEDAFGSWQLGTFNPDNFSIHLGDVSLNMMGLRSAEYNKLKKNVGFVLHLAMNPLYHLPYAHFKRLWLPELSRMISFCGNSKYPKSLHYPSSYNANFFTEEEDFTHLNSNAWQSGYAGFKWVSNKVLQNAFDQNLSGSLYDIPLVIGSEDQGICPTHYSIWLILDVFLKTGYYIDFEFKIIPIDTLTEIIVSNLLADKNDEGDRFLRPVLNESVTSTQFGNTIASFLGLKHTDQATLREACFSKRRFDFMIPPNFYHLLQKVNERETVIPDSYDQQSLPSAPMVFLSNLNQILSTKETQLSNNT